jgi:ATP-dependent Clp protease protease subunit
MRVILISGNIDESTFAKVDKKLTAFEQENGEPVTIRINSEGGNMSDGLAIVGRMTSSKVQVNTEGYGFIGSSALLVLACGKYRKISQFAWVMHHESAQEVSGSISELEMEVRQARREEQFWNKHMAKFSNQNSEFWRKSATKNELYLSPEQCLQYKIIDEII